MVVCSCPESWMQITYLYLNLPSFQRERVACLTSIFGAECILHCANTPHQEGISNAPKEFSNQSPVGFPYMHGQGNIVILCNKLFSFCCCCWSLNNGLMNPLMPLHPPDRAQYPGPPSLLTTFQLG